MIDRFKFRVWDEERKCFFNDDEVVIYPNGEESFFNADYDFTQCVVEQCTGLKDKNGKLIYEGDILKIIQNEWVKNKKYKPFWTVEYKNFSGELGFRVYGKNRRFNTRLSENVVYNSQAVVVGNIHENKELLDE